MARDLSDADDSRVDVERLIADAQALPLKVRLRLLDALVGDDVWERPDGLRFSLRSLRELRRARKETGADDALRDWIESFSPGDVLYDIGANTGAVSLFAAHQHRGQVRAFAFEPAADSFEALVRNLRLNEFGDAITALPIALFDESGVQPLFRASTGAGGARHAVGEAIDFARRTFAPAAVESVLALKLDDLVRWFGVPPPTRIKLDVDGAEARILAGAREVLTSSRCQLHVELADAQPGDAHAAGVMQHLAELGYELARTVEHRPSGQYPRVFDGLFVKR